MSPFSSHLSPVSLSLSFPSLTSKKEPLLSLLPLLPFLLRSHGKHERKVREAEPIERGPSTEVKNTGFAPVSQSFLGASQPPLPLLDFYEEYAEGKRLVNPLLFSHPASMGLGERIRKGP